MDDVKGPSPGDNEATAVVEPVTVTASDSAPPSAVAAAPGARTALVAGAMYILLLQVALRVRADGIVPVVISTLVFLGMLVWLSSAIGRALTDRRAVLISLTVATLLVVPARLMFALRIPVPLPWSLTRFVPGLSSVLLVWFACSLGAALARMLRGANMVPPVAAVLAFVDIWTVLLGGPVSKVMHSSAPAARAATQAFTVPLPTTQPNAAPMTVVGFADFLFIAFFVAAMCRFVPVPSTYRRTLIALVVVLCPYMALVMLSDWIPVLASCSQLPALVPVSLAMLLVHWRQFHYERSELFALLYAGCFIAAIVGAFWYFARRTAPREESRFPAACPRVVLLAAGDRVPCPRWSRLL
jgi:hypothetical protein